MALSREETGGDVERLERVRTLTTFLAILLGIVFIAVVYFIVTEGIEPSGWFSIAALLMGARFVLLARGLSVDSAPPTASAMRTTYLVFIGLYVVSWLSILFLRGDFVAIEYLGIAIVLVETYLMIQIQSDARRIAADALTQRPEAGAMSQSSASAQSATQSLRELAQLRDSGVLTEAEFQEKKADLLKRI